MAGPRWKTFFHGRVGKDPNTIFIEVREHCQEVGIEKSANGFRCFTCVFVKGLVEREIELAQACAEQKEQAPAR